MVHRLLHPRFSQIGKTVNFNFQSFFFRIYPLAIHFFIICVFFFCYLSVARAKVRKAKIDRQMIEALDNSMNSIDNVELVLKRFFKTQKDYREIDRDLALLAKSGITKMNLHFKLRGREVFLKSGKKTVFKFRPLTAGDKIRDFTFNVNGQKFFIDPNRSYSYHKKRMRSLLGISRQSLFESLVVKEAWAVFVFAIPPVTAVISGVVSVTTWGWRILTAAGTISYAKAVIADAAEAVTTETGEIEEDDGESSVTDGGGESASAAESSDCYAIDKKKFYYNCKNNEWRIFDPGIGQGKNCTQNKSYCGLNLNYTHFKNPGGTGGGKEKCVEKRTRNGVGIAGYTHRDCASGGQECLKEKKAIDICNRAGYAKLYTNNNLLFLQERLSELINKSIPKDSRLPYKDDFQDQNCIEFAEGDVEDSDKGGWGMKRKWAGKYCKAARDTHEGCSVAAKKCSSKIKEDLTQTDSSERRSTGTAQ